MAIKDFNGSENQDHGAKKTSITQPDEVRFPKATEQEEIKNAHATGDGSFGRSESSLPEEENQKQQGNNAY